MAAACRGESATRLGQFFLYLGSEKKARISLFSRRIPCEKKESQPSRHPGFGRVSCPNSFKLLDEVLVSA
jgi:hypothetical protein